ncbi:MAG: VOC family protein [Pseudomonadales bacterium]|nr:VOC family protein [Candidatus Woesebacteria bacterium]MCB9801629.1 VOC family protein [Pseudomonadales bacterium]
MTGTPIHFEIHADHVERAKTFYATVFGWTFEDYSEYTGSPYFGVTTGEKSELGINGGFMLRKGDAPSAETPVTGFVCTMGVESYDQAHQTILAAGGSVALEKYALPGMAWQGYYHDTEGNIFGIHEPDENAQ